MVDIIGSNQSELYLLRFNRGVTKSCVTYSCNECKYRKVIVEKHKTGTDNETVSSDRLLWALQHFPVIMWA